MSIFCDTFQELALAAEIVVKIDDLKPLASLLGI